MLIQVLGQEELQVLARLCLQKEALYVWVLLQWRSADHAVPLVYDRIQASQVASFSIFYLFGYN